jgi:glutathione S-transferase
MGRERDRPEIKDSRTPCRGRPMLELYYHSGACSLAPHLVLEWIGEPYDAVGVDFGDPSYLAINPAGAAPALDTGEGWILKQAGAILHYLARRFPEARLGGDGSLREEAEIARWSHFLTGDLHPAFFPLFAPQRFATARDPDALAAVKDAGAKLVEAKLELLDAHLEGKDHMVGARRTHLDAYALPTQRWSQALLPQGLGKRGNCARMVERLQAEAATKKVFAQEGL